MTDDSDEWRFEIDEVGDDADEEAAGLAPGDERIEGGSIDLENALFVVVGVVFAVLITLRFVAVLP